tara:strand:+ start:3174 stop:3395 length:222 start_codon:yes stop_codon:yes gene_type:complete
MVTDLHSSIKRQGEWVTQIIHFVGGEKRTFEGIDTKTIKQGQFTKLISIDGQYILINDKNVLCIEVFKYDKSK